MKTQTHICEIVTKQTSFYLVLIKEQKKKKHKFCTWKINLQFKLNCYKQDSEKNRNWNLFSYLNTLSLCVAHTKPTIIGPDQFKIKVFKNHYISIKL